MQLLDADTEGKVGGPPGDAFELVYTVVTDTVREKMHTVDPILAEYIRRVESASMPRENFKLESLQRFSPQGGKSRATACALGF